jgi:Zn-finger nucleic acid-binding protein
LSEPPYRAGVPYREIGDGTVCPRCPNGQLRPLTYGTLVVHACETCGGVFANRDVMDRVLAGDVTAFRELAGEATRAPPRPATTPQTLACPKCQSLMEPVRVERARCVVDVCAPHGVWFDRWEAQCIADAMSDASANAELRRALR